MLAAQPGVAVAVAHAQDGDSAQMSTCVFATNGPNVGPKPFPGVMHQPNGCGLTIIRTRRIGMFRCQAIFDGDNGLT